MSTRMVDFKLFIPKILLFFGIKSESTNIFSTFNAAFLIGNELTHC